MSDLDRTIVPGIRSDTYEGEEEPYGKSRIKVRPVDENGDGVSTSNPLPVKDQGAQEILLTANLLYKILAEIKKTNMYLAEMTGEEL